MSRYPKDESHRRDTAERQERCPVTNMLGHEAGKRGAERGTYVLQGHYGSQAGIDIPCTNPLGREMMVRQVARRFCRLGEVHSLVYEHHTSGKNGGENGRKLTDSTRVASESRPMNYLSLMDVIGSAHETE